jgi:archaemetzincin
VTVATLRIVPFYFAVHERHLQSLARRLERAFGLRSEVHAPGFDPETSLDWSRSQYSSRLLLARLLEEPATAGGRVLGVTAVDLFVPVLTFVFGEAQLDGRAAVVSVHRLRNELYGLPGDDVRLGERLEKESVHELAHTYGLVHCDDGRCVMRSSTYVEDIDLKSAAFCRDCRADLDRRRGDVEDV